MLLRRSLLAPLSSAIWALALVSGAQLQFSNDVSNGELICHTDNAVDCYPKVFSATTEFQKVHPDQDLPPGLHIRLNVWTGEKEAKINDPSEKDPALEGLPVDRAVVIVDPPESVEDGQTPPAQIPRGAPAYEATGKVKEPPASASQELHEAVARFKQGPMENRTAFDDALESLEDLSHDMYYGLKIAEDIETLKSLFCLMSSEDVFFNVLAVSVVSRARQAAATVAGVAQNNPVALRQIEMHWPTLMQMKCRSDGKLVPLGSLIFSTIIPDGKAIAASGRDPGPSLIKAKLSAMKGIIKSPLIRDYFLEKGGMRQILRVLLIKDNNYAEAQVKAVNLVADTFLDESMGATLGLWPRGNPSTANQCEGEAEGDERGRSVTEGCWDFHVARLADERRSDLTHWSVGLWAKIREQRERKMAGHDEL